jgi:hypothetical protein
VLIFELKPKGEKKMQITPLYDTASRRRQQARQRGQGHPRPQGPQRRPREEVRLADHHQGRRHRRQGDRAPRRPTRTWAPRWSSEVASKTSDVAGDGTTTATVSPRPSTARASRTSTAGANPMELKRGIDKACRDRRAEDQLAKLAKPVKGEGNRPGRHHLANNDERSAASSPTRWRRSARTA